METKLPYEKPLTEVVSLSSPVELMTGSQLYTIYYTESFGEDDGTWEY